VPYRLSTTVPATHPPEFAAGASRNVGTVAGGTGDRGDAFAGGAERFAAAARIVSEWYARKSAGASTTRPDGVAPASDPGGPGGAGTPRTTARSAP